MVRVQRAGNQVSPAVSLIVATAEEAHQSGDLLHVARISFCLSKMGYRLSDPSQIYGRYTCFVCERPWKVIYSGRLTLSTCCASSEARPSCH